MWASVLTFQCFVNFFVVIVVILGVILGVCLHLQHTNYGSYRPVIVYFTAIFYYYVVQFYFGIMT